MKKLATKKYSILSNILKYSFVIMFAVTVMSSIVFVNNVSGEEPVVTVKNPLGDNITDIPKFIEVLVTIVLTVGIPIVALAIIYTGFLFVAAQGNPEKLTKARKALLYTLIGGALLLGAFVIANAIGKTVDEIKKSA